MSLVAPQRIAARPAGDPLERLLGDLAVAIVDQRRIVATRDEVVALHTDEIGLVYVLDGSARLRTTGRTACDVSANRTVHADATGIRVQLSAGDALLTSGRRPASVVIDAGGVVLVSRLRLGERARHLPDLLPDAAWVSGFAEQEPAAAALAPYMGGECPQPSREGDQTICRSMATVLLQSVIRAWTSIGCAPEGWPAISADPFLERVAEAVREEPGRDWTVETLAALGAMSRSVFAARFRSTFGTSPAQYVTDVRMRTAQDMLARGRTVADVSRSLGYSSDEGFSRAFRRHTGMTPSSWRSEVPA